jgi:hypothetical protein
VIIELVSDLLAPQFSNESSLSARIRIGPRFKRFLYFVLIHVRCFHVAPKMSSRSLEVLHPRLNTTGLNHMDCPVIEVNLEFLTMDKVQILECYTPFSEHFRLNSKLVISLISLSFHVHLKTCNSL